VIDGTWEPGDVWHGIGDGMVGFAPFNDAIPEDVRAEAEDMRERILGRLPSLHRPAQPAGRFGLARRGRDGARRRPHLGMDFYVEGMTGTVPN
jgi:basic membrane protein A and related proteins